jgi:hypothetical protein
MNNDALQQLSDSDISTLPLATIDTQAPLVIDLPDGQKLVVGNLDPGTVIEVATWRGTGRPDSRTNRLMLGVSESENGGPTQDKVKANGSIKHVDSKPRFEEISAGTEAEVVVSQGNSMSYTASVSNIASEQVAAKQTRFKRLNLKSILKGLAITVAIALVFAALIGPGKMRIAHPQSGVASSLGSAENSLIILRQGQMGKVGDPVVVNVSEIKISPVLAVVNAVSGDNYLLATNTEQFQSSSRNIHGKVQFIIPYLGFFATLLNK